MDQQPSTQPKTPGNEKTGFKLSRRNIIIGLCLIVVGAGVLLINPIRNELNERATAKITEQIISGEAFEFTVPADVMTTDETDVWDFQTEMAAAYAGPTPAPAAATDQIKLTALGVLEIPRIESTQPLIEGAGKTELRYGVGHITGTAEVGAVGNCAVAGHRNYTYGQVWNRLNEVVVGDEIIITTNDKKVYTYKAYEIVILEPGDSKMLAWYQGSQQLTLITCDPVIVADKRLIIRCMLESAT